MPVKLGDHHTSRLALLWGFPDLASRAGITGGLLSIPDIHSLEILGDMNS